MAEKTEKGSDRGFLARTASITTKRAKRAQEKVRKTYFETPRLVRYGIVAYEQALFFGMGGGLLIGSCMDVMPSFILYEGNAEAWESKRDEGPDVRRVCNQF